MESNSKFPKHIFPKEVKDYITSYSESQGLCEDFMYSTYLSLASVLIGNSLNASIKGSWQEAPMVWVALVGNSGIKKTPAIKAILKPIQEIEAEKYKQYKISMSNNETLDKPNQLIVDDLTIEALYDILDNNPKGVLLKKDELITMITDGDRYSKSGGTTEKFLSIFSSAPIHVNRKSNNQFIYIDKPFVSIIGGIQPKITHQLFNNNRGDNGFVYRILFTTIGDYKPIAPNCDFNINVYLKYKNFILKFEQFNTFTETKNILLSNEAWHYFKDWQNQFIYKNDEERLVQYKSKLEGYVLRFALIIECSYCVSDSKKMMEISLTAVENAIKLATYYYSTFQEVLSLKTSTTNDPQLTILNKALKHFKNGLNQKEVILNLLKEGYKQTELSKYLIIPRTTIASYK